MMKKIGYIIGVIILLIGSINGEAKAQEQPVLDGVFGLRLGISIEEFMALIDTTQIEENYTTDWYRGQYIKIKKYTPKSKNDSISLDSYKFEDIRANFYDGTLYSFSFYDKKYNLEAIMTDKYGKPKSKGKLKTKTEKEYKPYAERTSEFDEVKKIHTVEVKDSRHKVWNTRDKDIVCWQFGNLYRIKNKKTDDMVWAENKKYRQEEEKERKRKEKEEEKKRERERKANPILDVL